VNDIPLAWQGTELGLELGIRVFVFFGRRGCCLSGCLGNNFFGHNLVDGNFFNVDYDVVGAVESNLVGCILGDLEVVCDCVLRFVHCLGSVKSGF
jgi:hypothetical protein